MPALEEFAQHLRGLREGGLVLHDDNLAKAFWARLSVLGASLNKLYNNADILCEFNNKTYGAVRSGAWAGGAGWRVGGWVGDGLREGWVGDGLRRGPSGGCTAVVGDGQRLDLWRPSAALAALLPA